MVPDILISNRRKIITSIYNRILIMYREWEKELTKAQTEFEITKDRKKTRTDKPSLARALLRVFWVPYMLQGLLLFIQSVTFHIMQPILQGWIISFFNSSSDGKSKNEALLYAGILIIATLGVVFINQHYYLRCQEIGMRARIACCSLIYRKV